MVGAVGTLVALNWSPEERIGTVDAPGLDPSLAGGGLSSRELGTDVLVQSLQSSETIGYQILQDAVEENVIGNFKQVPATESFSAEFRLDGAAFKLQFKDEDHFVLRYPLTRQGTADELFAIGSRYGFLSDAASSELSALDERTESLLAEFDARPLTVGVPESDLAADATTLASDWDVWIQEFGSESPDAELAQADRDLVSVVAEVSANPTNPGIDDYNVEVRRFNKALRDYDQGL